MINDTFTTLESLIDLEKVDGASQLINCFQIAFEVLMRASQYFSLCLNQYHISPITLWIDGCREIEREGRLTLRVWSNWPIMTSARFNVLSMFSCALRIECVLIYHAQIWIRNPKFPQFKSEIVKHKKCDKTASFGWHMITNESKKGDLGGTHGGFEGGEAVVEGAENGDHAVGDGLAFLERLAYALGPGCHDLHCQRNPHRFWPERKRENAVISKSGDLCVVVVVAVKKFDQFLHSRPSSEIKVTVEGSICVK